MRRKPWIYLAGPYRTPDPVCNTALAVARAREVRDDLGVVVIIPHLSLFEHFQKPGSDDYWLETTMDLMRGCDALYRFSMGYSAGSDAEILEAERLGIPVFKTLCRLTEWVQKWKAEHDVPDGGHRRRLNWRRESRRASV